MQTARIKKFSLWLSLLLALLLVFIAGIIFFFVRLYERDMQTLTEFMASYQVYDQAVMVASASVFDAAGENAHSAGAEERRINEALADLITKSSVQIPSLIKNEDEAMRLMQEIANLSNKEVNTLKAYGEAVGQEAKQQDLQQAFRQLTMDRQSAFAHFQELGR